MMSTVIVGALYMSIMVWAISHSVKNMKDSKCAGCSSSACVSRNK